MTTGEVIALIKAFGGGGGSSGGGVLVVNVTIDPESSARLCDKTAGEIMAVVDAGGIVVFKDAHEGGSAIEYVISAIYNDGSGYSFYTLLSASPYTAESANDYPASGDK